MNKFLSFILILGFVVIFFWQFLLKGLVPIPADTIVGLYHPFRDFYAKDYPRGIPFKNFMITDPVRQQYPWKNLIIELEKKGQLPLWNPYTFAGGPLLANFQSGAFYPFNLIFFLLPFPTAWGFFILLQPFLALIFLFLYLDNLKLDKRASILGALSFAFGGFSISWLEWSNVIHTVLWLPLILLSIDKIISTKKNFQFSVFPGLAKRSGAGNFQFNTWWLVLLFSLLSSFFAGHLQIFFYVSIFSIIYFLARWIQYGKNPKVLWLFLILNSLFLILTFAQWYPTFKFIISSARNLDLASWREAGWFVPWQNIVQIIIPDFFGNPATLNYFGVWNYGEFVSYIGIGSFIFVLFALFRKDKKTLFFVSALLVSLLFALPTIFAKIPYKFNFPFLSTSQPTRLIFIADFSLSVLAAFGFDYFLKTENKKKVIYVLSIAGILFTGIWLLVLFNTFSLKEVAVTKQNLILPTILLVINSLLIIVMAIVKNKKTMFALSLFIVLFLFFDLLRFGWKYTPFTNKDYLYPNTKAIKFLKENLGNYRYMATDSRFFPPNFSIMYKLQSLDGYDPLYLESYGEFMAATGRNDPNIDKPFGFNRIITPQNYHNSLINLLGVKYVLAFENLDNNPGYKKVFSEGETNVYENLNVLPRAFFISNIYSSKDSKDTISKIYKYKDDLRTNAVVQGFSSNKKYNNGEAKIVNYSENKIEILTKNNKEGFLVLTDSFYPTWHAMIDGKETKIYKTDYNFRGIEVPKGNHNIEFYITLF
nr:YfhO family protein [Candidatus Levybacteria bacterium]